MRPPFLSPIVRLRILPDEPSAVAGPRPRGSRRPHADAKLAQVRRLIEETVLTYGEIAARTGVGRASICRWTRDGGWKRPAFAPRATDTVPTARASARLKARKLAARLFALAERTVRELEETPGVDLDKLAEALDLLKMAKLATMGRRRRRRDTALAQGMAIRQSEPPREAMRPIAQLCAADVDLHRAPRPAIEDFLTHRDPPRQELGHEEPGPRRRTRRSKRRDHHAWMLERERERERER